MPRCWARADRPDQEFALVDRERRGPQANDALVAGNAELRKCRVQRDGADSPPGQRGLREKTAQTDPFLGHSDRPSAGLQFVERARQRDRNAAREERERQEIRIPKVGDEEGRQREAE